jgi:hypothetical protein
MILNANSTNMENQVYNAVHDFTEKDRVASNYRMLWENKLRRDAQQFEIDKEEEFSDSLKSAIKDLTVWLAFIAIFAIIMVIAAR